MSNASPCVPQRYHAPESIGPPCPECGCGETFVVSIPKLCETFLRGERGLAWQPGIAQCQHCETVFDFHPLEPAEEPSDAEYAKEVPFGNSTKRTRRCPYCGSIRTDVVTTRRPTDSGTVVRYHKCLACWGNFKSVQGKGERNGE